MNKKFAQEPWVDQDTPAPRAGKESPENTRRKYEWLTGPRRDSAGESDAKEQPSASIELQSIGPGAAQEAISSTEKQAPGSTMKITLLSYSGKPALTLNILPTVVEIGPSLTRKGQPFNASIVTTGPSNDVERSLKLPPGSPVYVEVSAKGAVSIGIGTGAALKYLQDSELEYAGLDVYVNLVCAEQEKCGDFGVKAKLLNTTIKREGIISFDQGAAYMGADFFRNMQSWYSNPQ